MKRVRRFFIKLARKICHSGGHGIHSPFAFDFVANVVYNPCPYYFFDTFAASEKERKVGELLFRIVERYKLLSVVTVGQQHPFLAAYTVAVSSAIKRYDIELVKTGEKEVDKGLFLEPTLFLFDDDATKEGWMEFYREIKDSIHDHSVIAVMDIQENIEKRAIWNEFSFSQTGVMFDLYDIGIIFFKKGLHKKRYIVSF